jgi:hypothetical protein
MYRVVADLMCVGVRVGAVARALLVSRLTLVLMVIAAIAFGGVVGGTAAQANLVMQIILASEVTAIIRDLPPRF